MIINKIVFQEQANIFLQQLHNQLEEKRIKLNLLWPIDHICFRAETTERYLELKDDFSQFGSLLIESDVNGRPISTYKLHTPISFQGKEIPLVELPAPKKGQVTLSGFEHIEIVCDLPFDHLKKMLIGCSLDESALSKEINQELKVSLNGCSIKFHHLSLEAIIALEKNKKVFNAIKETGVINLFKTFNDDLPAWIIPQSLVVTDSSFDVTFFSNNREAVLESLKKFFKQFEPQFLFEKKGAFFSFFIGDIAITIGIHC